MPEIVGGLLTVGGRLRPLILMVNGPIERVSRPSVTLMVMSPLSPTLASSGMPVSVPVSVSKVAQDGWLVMKYSR